MPLEPGSSREVVSGNIKREMRAGKPQKQAIAISLKKAGKSNQESMEALKHAGRALKEAKRREGK